MARNWASESIFGGATPAGSRKNVAAPRWGAMAALALWTVLGVIRADGALAQSAPAPGDPPPFAHGVAMHGALALPADFAHLPYADPTAPRGGVLRFGERSGFDSLNPFTIRGRTHWSVRHYTIETLLSRSWDEPFTLYGLLADGVYAPPERDWVEFRLDPDARFSNGAPLTTQDVIFSFETLRDKGRPNHRSFYGQVAAVSEPGPGRVRFDFQAPNRELPLLLGLMPILSADDWADRDITAPSMTPILGTGPYVLEAAEDGRRLVYRRNPDYWAADRPIAAGLHNPETVEYQFFRDGGSLFEAFTAGGIDVHPEGDPAAWADNYDFPAAREGRVVLAELPHGRPSSMRGFVFNTRRALFQDRRVREALALAHDAAWVNERFFAGGFTRITSYFSGSVLGFQDPAAPAEREILAPFPEAVPPQALETGWRPPKGAGDGRNRRALRQARALLEEAGWRVGEGGALRNADGGAFAFEILLSASGDERLALAFADALDRLGIEATPRLVDQTQYQDRLTGFDFDMIIHRWYLSLSPGEEQRFYWGSAAAETPGSRNYMGATNPAVDAAIDRLVTAETLEGFQAAARALDRALSWGVYVVPFGYLDRDLIAHWARIARPERTSLFGFRPEVWWVEDDL